MKTQKNTAEVAVQAELCPKDQLHMPKLTERQTYFLLSDISIKASALQRMAVNLCAVDDHRDAEAMRVVIEALAERIGYLADMGITRLDWVGSCTVGDANAWMMPPVFHEDEPGHRPPSVATGKAVAS